MHGFTKALREGIQVIIHLPFSQSVNQFSPLLGGKFASNDEVPPGFLIGLILYIPSAVSRTITIG